MPREVLSGFSGFEIIISIQTSIPDESHYLRENFHLPKGMKQSIDMITRTPGKKLEYEVTSLNT